MQAEAPLVTDRHIISGSSGTVLLLWPQISNCMSWDPYLRVKINKDFNIPPYGSWCDIDYSFDEPQHKTVSSMSFMYAAIN